MKPACLLLLLACAPFAGAQIKVDIIHIHVLNGHNGKPIPKADSFTTVLPAGTFANVVTTTTDRAGVQTVYIPTTSSLQTFVKHHATCDTVPRGQRKFGSRPVAADAIMATGVVSGNRCGKRSVAPTPGELTLYVRPSHWWQRLGY